MEKQVWLVTGASKGLGLELVRCLLAKGVNVAATSRSKEALQKAIADERLLSLEVDLVDPLSAEVALQQVVERFGRLDVLVNNAGYGQMGAVEEVSDVQARRNFDVNVFGVINMLRAALPYLRQQRSGQVFNVSSIAGFVGGFAGFGIYCASKFALTGLTEGLRAELAEFGIRVNLVAPGYFRTDFLASGSIQGSHRTIPGYGAVRVSERNHLQSIHTQQPGDPKKLAELMLRMAQSKSAPDTLFAGSDAFRIAQERFATLLADLEAQRELSVSTDFAS